MVDQALIDEMAADLDHHDPRLGDVSHEVYRAMRERCPIAHSDRYGGFWIITGFDEAHDAYQRYDLFTAYPDGEHPGRRGSPPPMLPLEVDPPIHGKYRSLLAPVFSPPRIQALEPTIRKFCDELIDVFIDRGKCEFVSEFASPFPTMIFGLMMDIPMSEAQQCHRWKDMVLHGHADDPDGTKRAQAGADLQAYLSGVAEDARRTGATTSSASSSTPRSTARNSPTTSSSTSPICSSSRGSTPSPRIGAPVPLPLDPPRGTRPDRERPGVIPKRSKSFSASSRSCSPGAR